MSREEFDGRPFIAGSLIGIRAFKVDSQGQLTGVIYDREVFASGENVGRCLLSSFAQTMQRISRAMAEGLGFGASKLAGTDRPHVLAGLGCQCGFYAYFKGKNSYIGRGQVAGLIEGYGVATVGTRGFRAEKARLVALIAPRDPRLRLLSRAWAAYARLVRSAVRPALDKIAHWTVCAVVRAIGLKRGLPILRATANCDRNVNVMQTGLGVAFILAGFFVPGVPSLALTLAGWSLIWALPKPPNVDATPPLSAAEFARVRARYSDVPVYRSRRAALKAHPLTPPDRKQAS